MGFSKVSEAFSFCLAGFQAPRGKAPRCSGSRGPRPAPSGHPLLCSATLTSLERTISTQLKENMKIKLLRGRQRPSPGGPSARPGGIVRQAPRCGLPADRGSPCPSPFLCRACVLRRAHRAAAVAGCSAAQGEGAGGVFAVSFQLTTMNVGPLAAFLHSMFGNICFLVVI